jgi:hypothetical protein
MVRGLQLAPIAPKSQSKEPCNYNMKKGSRGNVALNQTILSPLSRLTVYIHTPTVNTAKHSMNESHIPILEMNHGSFRFSRNGRAKAFGGRRSPSQTLAHCVLFEVTSWAQPWKTVRFPTMRWNCSNHLVNTFGNCYTQCLGSVIRSAILVWAVGFQF